MATMVPSLIPDNTRSRGEMEVFRRIEADPATADWIVLHSLGLADHDERVAGEVDFVALIPGHGVLCIEVKGCSSAHLRRDDRGLWFYGPNDRGDPRGPFKQAAEAMHSLRGQLLRSHPRFQNVQFSSGVIFPFAQFQVRSPEWHDWEYIDSRQFRGEPISRLLVRLMVASREHLLRSPNSPMLDARGPLVQDCREIKDVLRGAFEAPIDPKARAADLERQLIRFTSEQFTALDGMAVNPRAIFEGPAGVGKTLLAVESARRSARDGHRVLLVCYNRLLGAWLHDHLEDESKITAGTLHRHMLSVAGLRRPPDGATERFWSEELPAQASDQLLGDCSDDDPRVFDEIVIDEGQDLLYGPYLDFLDLSLRGGLTAGRWRLFGDFENQAIYGSTRGSLEDFTRNRAESAARYSLRVNCRNTHLTTEWTRLLAGLSPGYSRVLRPDDGVSPTILFYDHPQQRVASLIDALTALTGDGFEGRDIAVLSSRADDACAAAAIDSSPWRDRLRPIERASAGQIRYGTIHTFKGLEAPAVIVTDIESLSTEHDRALLYVATTRPLQRLVLNAQSRVREQARRLLA